LFREFFPLMMSFKEWAFHFLKHLQLLCVTPNGYQLGIIGKQVQSEPLCYIKTLSHGLYKIGPCLIMPHMRPYSSKG
jgi:hypothetical protein